MDVSVMETVTIAIDPAVPTYIAGPMTGYDKFNIPAFLDAKAQWESDNYKVQLPADLDDPDVVDYLLTTDGSPGSSENTWADCLAMDVKLIGDVVGAVAVLPGWEKSKGARLETFVARLVGKPIVYAANREPVPDELLAEAWNLTND